MMLASQAWRQLPTYTEFLRNYTFSFAKNADIVCLTGILLVFIYVFIL